MKPHSHLVVRDAGLVLDRHHLGKERGRGVDYNSYCYYHHHHHHCYYYYYYYYYDYYTYY